MGSITRRYSGNEPARSAPTPPPPNPPLFSRSSLARGSKTRLTVEIEFSQSVGRSKSDRWEGGGGGGEGDSLAAQHSKSCNFETEQQK